MTFGGKIRLCGYYIKDLLNNKKEDRIFTQWKDIRDILSSYEKGWPRVEKSLKDCLQYATSHTDFYKKYVNCDLSEFPVLNKMDFINNFSSIKVKDYENQPVHISSTSGSTGTPFKVIQNKGKRNRVLAELQYLGEIIGYPSHEKMIFYRSCHELPFWKCFFSNVWQPESSVLSEENIQNLLNLQKNARAIIGYASTLDVISKFCLRKKRRGSLSVTTVIAGSEILLPETRENCQKVWPNASVISRYSNMENGILAQNYLGGRDDDFLCNWASYYFEVLKMDSNMPAKEGELGRIVITDMFNKAFPIIRYDTGDVGCLKTGKNGWKYLSNISGRRADLIYDSKKNIISSHVISRIMIGIKYINQWQFIQEDVHKYRLKFSSISPKAHQELEVKIQKFKEVLGQKSEILLEAVSEIPVLASGKRKSIVQQWKGHP